MADSPISPRRVGEPATTREEIDFNDNEHEQETGRVSPTGRETVTPAVPLKSTSPRPRVSFQEGHEELGPNKPPRPLSSQQQAENTLIEAFPSIDAKVVKAVLMASGGKVEPAFNALLGMTDPTAAAEEQPPPQPPRPALRQPRNQLEADELYARQLAEQYNASPPHVGQHTYNQREPGRRGPNQQRQYNEEPERSFFDDDLPEITRNIQQGFQETQKKINSWVQTLKKRLDGEDEEDLYTSSQPSSRSNTDRWASGGEPGTAVPNASARSNFGASQADQLRGIQRRAETQSSQRRSTEAQRYDADPHEFDDEAFERLELRDEEAPPPMPPRVSSRQPANPNLFKSPSPSPSVPTKAVVPPQSGPVDEVDAADRKNLASGTQDPKAKKWQPLTSIAPAAEEDNDPFSVGDDEEETTNKMEDVRKEDTERLKAAARKNSNAAATTTDSGKTLEEAPRKGSINSEAEALLSKK